MRSVLLPSGHIRQCGQIGNLRCAPRHYERSAAIQGPRPGGVPIGARNSVTPWLVPLGANSSSATSLHCWFGVPDLARARARFSGTEIGAFFGRIATSRGRTGDPGEREPQRCTSNPLSPPRPVPIPTRMPAPLLHPKHARKMASAPYRTISRPSRLSQARCSAWPPRAIASDTRFRVGRAWFSVIPPLRGPVHSSAPSPRSPPGE